MSAEEWPPPPETDLEAFEEVDTGLVPTHGAWTASQIAGVVTGGVLLAITLALTAYGMLLSSGMIR